MEENKSTSEGVLQENKTTEQVVETLEQVKDSLPELNYSEASRQELVDHLKTLVNDFSPLEIKTEVEHLKRVFYLKLSKEVVEMKAKFIEANTIEGEETPEFKAPKDDLEGVLKAELARYRKIKNDLYAKQENERAENLKIKEDLIEDLKSLVNTEESLGKTFEAFHSIQDRWRTTGSVPAANNNGLWQTYHLHVENFYDYIKINKDLRDLDFKKNQEKKEGLCEKAEALEAKKSPIEAFKALQILHQQWKETGPVSNEQREPLWNRFKAATTAINKRHQDHFTDLKERELENLKKKEDLCEKVEAIANSKTAKAKEWNDNVKEVQKLQEEWRTVGIVPKKYNTVIYQRFRKGCDTFFNHKREFYKIHKSEQMENLDKKKALIAKAAEMQNSEDWKTTADELIKLQKEWKTIGTVPKQHSDKVWNQFREACDIFFQRKKDFYGDSDEKQAENLALKTALIEKIKSFTPSETPQEDIKELLKFKDEWMKIGHVPMKVKNQITSDYHNELNAQFDKLNLAKDVRELEKFRSKIEDITDKSGDKLYGERKRLSMKLKEMESDIATWENNIGFLSNSKGAESLAKEYTGRIEKAKEQKLLLVKKIRMIDALD